MEFQQFVLCVVLCVLYVCVCVCVCVCCCGCGGWCCVVGGCGWQIRPGGVGSGAVAIGLLRVVPLPDSIPTGCAYRRRDALKLPTRRSLRACVSSMLRELFGKCGASEATHMTTRKALKRAIVHDKAYDRRRERELNY